MVYHIAWYITWVISHACYITWYVSCDVCMLYSMVYSIPCPRWYIPYVLCYIPYTYIMVYHIYWYITVVYITCLLYNMVYTIQILWYNSYISHVWYHRCDIMNFICDIPCDITELWYTNMAYHSSVWYITVFCGISHILTFQIEWSCCRDRTRARRRAQGPSNDH